jgi:DDE superfamily endonuclease
MKIMFLISVAFFRRKITWTVSDKILFGSIDGTHCRIQEPRRAPSTDWYSHKFNGPGLTYQIVLSTYEDKVLSVIGPYPAGVPDLNVFRKDDGIYDLIPPDKRLIGDNGYNGEYAKITTPNNHDSHDIISTKNRARARHETFNKRLKDYSILRETFRHSKSKKDPRDNSHHQMVFQSICVLVQYDMKYVPLFDL